MPQMVIANRLVDGVVVFLTSGDGWATWIGDGRVLETGDEAEQALAAAKRHEDENIVVEASLIDVAVEDGQVRPTAVREAIRAFGPTVGSERERKGPTGSTAAPQAVPERA